MENLENTLKELMLEFESSGMGIDDFVKSKLASSGRNDAAECAESIGAKNLILFHTEDKHLATRKHTYTKEAKQYFSGTTYVPDDLDTIIL